MPQSTVLKLNQHARNVQVVTSLPPAMSNHATAAALTALKTQHRTLRPIAAALPSKPQLLPKADAVRNESTPDLQHAIYELVDNSSEKSHLYRDQTPQPHVDTVSPTRQPLLVLSVRTTRYQWTNSHRNLQRLQMLHLPRDRLTT